MPESLSRLGQALSETVLTVESRDGCVTVEVTGGRMLRFTVAPGAFRKHSEKSLTDELNSTVTVAMEEFGKYFAQLRAEYIG